ncbi:MAG: 2-amino-4-hydroxy-6-hydroxymethyldihydropteridine diphosphokinase [Micrococcales bacterium]|nr:2-amino-4-hydroxy-6-hydroxymethyldihydropteridine diphosphokinase [Actinomycetota bacterium]NCA08090.1 2-amino-4-hydroxy-6-hydroxymethyldihydropteridine diphosphokinase [Micrococcales bacterium]
MATKVVIALGSNLGERRNWIIQAIARIAKIPGTKVTKYAPIFESKALTLTGIDASKPEYLNTVIEVKTKLKPEELLLALQAIENLLGRLRKERWGDRTIDIDIITYGQETFSSRSLVIPHPEAANRSFVIVPWYVMDQSAKLPGIGRIEKLAVGYVGQVKIK